LSCAEIHHNTNQMYDKRMFLSSSYLKLSYFIGITYKGGSYVVPTPNCCNIFL
jgi:hypothetical protein